MGRKTVIDNLERTVISQAFRISKLERNLEAALHDYTAYRNRYYAIRKELRDVKNNTQP